MRFVRAWEYFSVGDEVDVWRPGPDSYTGLVTDVRRDGSGIWVYLNGVGRRYFDVEDDVQITRHGTQVRAIKEGRGPA